MAPKAKKRHKATTPSKLRISPKPSSSKPASSSQDVEDSSTICSICAEQASDWAVGSCSHVICGNCSHRMRVLYNRKACVMCNETLRQVVVVPLRDYRNGMTFEEAVALPGVFQDKQTDMWFVNRSRYQQLRHVRGFKCSHKACSNRPSQDSVFANATQLRAHARSEHHSVYCEICFSGKKMFVSELPLYHLDNEQNYSSRLRGHLRKDHPQCKFCRHYYLDDEKLYAHLQERHETCSICERNGRMHEYYLNFEQLERHYAKEHYVCTQESCRGVVFATQIELQAHLHSRHNDGTRGNRSRAFRVDLAQLHGARDTQRSSSGNPQEVERERERQAARRRAFLSSNVVFSGAFNMDDSTADPLPGEASEPPPAQSSIRPVPLASQPSTGGDVSVADAVQATRRPDDGRFHPLELPRNSEEFQARNAILVRTMRSLLDPAAYEQFKQSSGQFHVGNISADKFYDAAVDAFGVRTAVRDILPELVALLPSHLLREPLLQTCLRRTDTKPEDVGYLRMATSASTSTSAGSLNSAAMPEEQFPALIGASAPQRSTPNTRRFGTPGPEEFPRLNRVNRPRETAEAQQDSSKRQSAQTSYATASTSILNVPKAGSTNPQQTAASVLRQRPVPQRIFGNKPASGSASKDTEFSGTQIRTGEFPALGAVDVIARDTRNVESERKDCEQANPLNQPDSSVPTDLSMRVGAVWGGAAARVHERAGRKRGPGKGQGKRPASPPRPVILNTSNFPNIRGSSSSRSNISSGLAHGNMSRGDTSPRRSTQNTPRKNKVIDVVEISKTRAAAKSNLPKIGGSGYGFAWDRRKVQRKKKEIKESASENTNKNAGSSNHGSSEGGSTSNLPTMAISADGKTYLDKDSVTSANTSIIEDVMQDMQIDETAAAPTSGSAERPQNFDPYSYIPDDTDDMVASFLGGKK